MDEPRRSNTPERKAAFYIGNGMVLLGLLLFLSAFLSAAMNFGDFTDFTGRVRSMAVRSVLGIILMIAGGFVHGAGRRGLGSFHPLLDPEKLHEHLDQLNCAGEEPKVTARIRCRYCQGLNDEQAKTCEQCGASL